MFRMLNSLPTRTASAFVCALVGILGLSDRDALAGGRVVYSTDFELGAGPEWSNPQVDSSDPDFTAFSGRFDNFTQTLTIPVTPGVPSSLSFDLFIIDSWDLAQDLFGVVIDGTTLLNFDFSNYPFNGPVPADQSEVDLGFGFWVDSVFRNMTFEFVPEGSTVSIEFFGSGLQGVSDESWGIDNVAVAQSVTEQKVLVVNVNGSSYNGDGFNLHQSLLNSGVDSTFINLAANGAVANVLAAETFDQIWIFDLSANGSDGTLYSNDWAAIANWFNADPSRGIICDGRIISSYWSGRWQTEGRLLSENYYVNLRDVGGGLMIGTDHNVFQAGVNTLNQLIGILPFSGNFSLSFIPVDQSNPLMNMPNDMGTQLFDDSSPGQTPFGIQPNGRLLYTVAWHSGNTATPGISSTIPGAINAQIDITSPANGSAFYTGQPIQFAASVAQAVPPFTVSWALVAEGGSVPLGTGESITVSDLPGTPTGQSHTIVATVVDSVGAADEDTVQVVVTSAPDLVVTQINSPCSATVGENVSISWTVQNVGDAPASGTWNDSVYASLSPVVGGTLLVTATFTGTVAPGESYTLSAAGVVPQGIPAPANAYVSVIADSGDALEEGIDEGNNGTLDDATVKLVAPGVVTLLCWTEEDYAGDGAAGDWQVSPDGLSVTQLINGAPAYFASDFALVDSNFEGTFRVNDGSDDDFIGFVFAYNGLGPETSYYLVTWKRAAQDSGEAGFKLLKVNGVPNDATVVSTSGEIWDGENSAHIQVLATKLGAANGWAQSVTYRFFLAYQENGSIRVVIRNDSTQAVLWDTGLIVDPEPLGVGRVGFFNYSQEAVVYAGFTSEALESPTAVVGGPYAFSAIEQSITLDATASFDPDLDGPGLFNGIVSLQWDLGADGIGPEDVGLTNPTESIPLASAVAKGLALGSPLAIALTVVDADGLEGTALGQITYQNSPPFVTAGGPYGILGPGRSTTLLGEVTDPDLGLGVGESLVIEWDDAQAVSAAQIGDGFATTAEFLLTYETLATFAGGEVVSLYLNAADQLGTTTSSMTEIQLLAPDLVASVTSTPTEGFVGTSASVSWSVINSGAIPASGPWSDRVFVSNDPVYDASDVALATLPSPLLLGPRGTYERTTQVLLPATPGPWWIVVVSDFNNNVFEAGAESNNTTVAASPVVLLPTPKPDLIITAVGTPSPAAPGAPVEVTWTVSNQDRSPLRAAGSSASTPPLTTPLEATS